MYVTPLALSNSPIDLLERSDCNFCSSYSLKMVLIKHGLEKNVCNSYTGILLHVRMIMETIN